MYSHVIKSIILSQLLLETNEMLVGTRFYKKEFKRDLNRCIKSLEGMTLGEYDKIYDTDPFMVTNILNKIDSLATMMQESSVEDLIMIENIVRKYNENKDDARETDVVWFDKLDMI
jgi:hypothetical protein